MMLSPSTQQRESRKSPIITYLSDIITTAQFNGSHAMWNFNQIEPKDLESLT